MGDVICAEDIDADSAFGAEFELWLGFCLQFKKRRELIAKPKNNTIAENLFLVIIEVNVYRVRCAQPGCPIRAQFGDPFPSGNL